MEVTLKHDTITIKLDKEDDRKGFFAVISSQPNTVTPEQAEKGTFIWWQVYQMAQTLSTSTELKEPLKLKRQAK